MIGLVQLEYTAETFGMNVNADKRRNYSDCSANDLPSDSVPFIQEERRVKSVIRHNVRVRRSLIVALSTQRYCRLF